MADGKGASLDAEASFLPEICRQRAAMYSVIKTAKLNGVEPQAYIADIIERSPEVGTSPSRGTGRPSSRILLRPLSCGLQTTVTPNLSASCSRYSWKNSRSE